MALHTKVTSNAGPKPASVGFFEPPDIRRVERVMWATFGTMSGRLFDLRQPICWDTSPGASAHTLSVSALASRMLLCIVTLLLAPGEAFSAPDKAMFDQQIPVCIYASKTYSAGALLCVHKSVALICKNEGLQVSWVTVSDKELTDRCVGPTVHAKSGWRMRSAYQVRHPAPSPSSAKCFDFGGKRYCE